MRACVCARARVCVCAVYSNQGITEKTTNNIFKTKIFWLLPSSYSSSIIKELL